MAGEFDAIHWGLRKRIEALELLVSAEEGEKTMALPPEVMPSPETLIRRKWAALGFDVFLGAVNARDEVWYRAKNVVELAERYNWHIPDYIIRSQIRYLREAIERWEAEQEV